MILHAIYPVVPILPNRLRVLDKGVNTASVSWEDPINYRDYLEYELRYGECGLLAGNNVLVQDTNYELIGLMPGTCYVVEVRTEAGTGPEATLSAPAIVQFITGM